MSTITTRAGKGSPLTNSEVDSNFTNLNDDKLEDAPSDGSQYARQNGAWATVSASGSSTFAGLTEIDTADLDVHDIAFPATTVHVISANGSTAYRSDHNGTSDNPKLYVDAGQTIAFDLTALSGSHPFRIRSDASTDYDTGVLHIATDGTRTTGTNAQGKTSGVLYWKVPATISGTYKYACGTHSAMIGDIEVADPSSTGSSYSNSDVDTHLNTSSASTNQILSWNGSDYAWVADQTGSGGGGGGVTSYTNLAAFPSSGNSSGDLAVAQDTKALYMWDGSEWDRIATGDDESPVVVTEPPTTEQLLNTDGSTSTVTMTAQDPEGFTIVYGIAYNTSDGSRPAQLATDTTINQSTGVYTFDPTTTQSDAGSFKARLSASDGVKSTTRTVDFKLEFPPIIEILLVAGGGGGNDAAGGGGGAGGLVYDSSYQASSGTYTINVGSGGAKSSGQANAGSTGSDSSFVYNDTNVYVADGGGGGGPYPASSGTQDGGSGGGGGRATGGTDNGSATQASYGGKGFGNDGGSPYSNGGGGGGGGAGGVGGTATSSAGGDGGAGKAISITGSSVNYACGGPAGGYNVSEGSLLVDQVVVTALAVRAAFMDQTTQQMVQQVFASSLYKERRHLRQATQL